MKRLFSIEDALSLKVFTNRVPIDLSPDGRWLAFSVQTHFSQGGGGEDPYLPTGVMIEMANSEIWVTDTQSGESQIITPDWGSSWAPRWSPDGEYLAFYSDKNGKAQLWVWHRDTGQARPVCEEPVRSFFGFEVPKWTPDGTQIICKLRPEELSTTCQPESTPAEKSDGSMVQVWEHIPDVEEKQEECKTKESSPAIPSWSDRYLADIAVVTVATGKAHRLTSGLRPLGFDASPDGKYVASLSFAGMESPSAQQVLYDLYLVSLQGEEPPRRLVQGIRQDYGLSVSWSPDGRYIAYTTCGQLAREDVFVVCISDGSVRNLTENVDAKFGNSYERPLWSTDGEYLLCTAGRRPWQVFLDGRLARNLTSGFDRNVDGILRPSGSHTVWSPDGGRSVYVRTHDIKSKKHGFYQIDLASGESTPLLEEDKWYGGSSSAGRFNQVVSHDGRRIAYIAEDARHPADMWMADSGFQNRRKLTKLNPQLENMQFGEMRSVSWQANEGKRLQGVLLLPPDYTQGKCYPLITRIYGGRNKSRFLNRFGLDGATVDNMQLLAAHGYAVFMPNVPMETGRPLREVGEAVLPGVDKVIEMGIADPEALGLIGHSYGGYCVNCLITQTTRFRAAVSSAGISDLISLYGSLGKNGDDSGTGWAESGQGRMGGTLWEFPERYIENSPVFYLDKVETPLLLIQGTADFIPAQAEEMFSGLRRLGKRVSLARYPDADHWHGFWSYENVVDYWKRVIAWFDEHLKF